MEVEQYAINVAMWLQKRGEDAEAKDPALRPMKDKINEISEQVKLASKQDLPRLINAQTEAINILLKHVESRGAGL